MQKRKAPEPRFHMPDFQTRSFRHEHTEDRTECVPMNKANTRFREHVPAKRPVPETCIPEKREGPRHGPKNGCNVSAVAKTEIGIADIESSP
jgi:hypothetical protein